MDHKNNVPSHVHACDDNPKRTDIITPIFFEKHQMLGNIYDTTPTAEVVPIRYNSHTL